MPTLVRHRLGGDENLYIVFLTVFSVSIAIGSGLAAWLAHGRILLLPTPVAGVLMSIFAIDVGVATWSASAQGTVSPLAFLATLHGARIVFDLFGMAVAGGLFIVPAFSAIQSWAGEDRRARVVAANNVVSAAYIVVAALDRRRIAGRGVQRRAGARRPRPRRDRRRPRRLPRRCGSIRWPTSCRSSSARSTAWR